MERLPRRPARVALGAALWLAAAVGVVLAVQARGAELGEPSRELLRYAVARPRTVEVELAAPVVPGDPVLDAERRYVGRVLAVRGSGPRRQATLVLDPEVVVAAGTRYETRRAPRDSAAWVLQTLLPEDKRKIVFQELDGFLAAHEDEVAAFLRPIAEDVIAHGMTVLEGNLTAAVEARDREIKAILDRHRVMVQEEIVPVLKERLGPKAKKKAEPILREIGRELWDELPMWSLGWRAFVDVIPGTSQDRVDRWWAEFVNQKAIPILAAREEELLKILEELIEEGARDPAIRKALAGATERLARDPEFKAVVRGIIEDALVRPFDARALFRELLEDEAHQRRLRHLEDAFAPTLKRIGRLLTVDPETGRIDPDLARVLRRVVFGKDARWVEAVGPEARGF